MEADSDNRLSQSGRITDWTGELIDWVLARDITRIPSLGDSSYFRGIELGVFCVKLYIYRQHKKPQPFGLGCWWGENHRILSGWDNWECLREKALDWTRIFRNGSHEEECGNDNCLRFPQLIVFDNYAVPVVLISFELIILPLLHWFLAGWGITDYKLLFFRIGPWRGVPNMSSGAISPTVSAKDFDEKGQKKETQKQIVDLQALGWTGWRLFIWASWIECSSQFRCGQRIE